MTDDDNAADAVEESEPPPSAPLLELREPRPSVIESRKALVEYSAALAQGTGPVAIDAERASGYRYSQRAYLVQVRREGAGIALIDPIGLDGLDPLDTAIGENEWILHAATQDLMCLAEIGLRPRHLFDTELAGRLLNFPRVGLASLVEHYFGRALAKEHSAVDWSKRPLLDEWLEYAALDVEILCELRDHLDADLEEAGKRAWAQEEFDALLSFTGPPKREDPWRRTSGIHKVRGRRGLGIARAVWETRDAIAEKRDVTPGRILPDSSIVEFALNPPHSMSELTDMRIMRNRGPRRFADQWLDAITEALAAPEADLPTAGARREGPPPPRAWADKDPDAADRLGRARAVLATLSEDHNLPAENLLSPSTVRALAWQPPADTAASSIAQTLASAGARPWQIELTADQLSAALTAS